MAVEARVLRVQILTSGLPYAGLCSSTNPHPPSVETAHTRCWLQLAVCLPHSPRILLIEGCPGPAQPLQRQVPAFPTSLPSLPYACSLHNSSHRIFGPAAASNSSLNIFQFLFQENPGSPWRKTKKELHPSPPIRF